MTIRNLRMGITRLSPPLNHSQRPRLACVGDSVADRIREALQALPDGLTRTEIWNLFRGHVNRGSIDQALEKLRSLQLLTSCYVTGRGRPTTL